MLLRDTVHQIPEGTPRPPGRGIPEGILNWTSNPVPQK